MNLNSQKTLHGFAETLHGLVQYTARFCGNAARFCGNAARFFLNQVAFLEILLGKEANRNWFHNILPIVAILTNH